MGFDRSRQWFCKTKVVQGIGEASAGVKKFLQNWIKLKYVFENLE